MLQPGVWKYLKKITQLNSLEFLEYEELCTKSKLKVLLNTQLIMCPIPRSTLTEPWNLILQCFDSRWTELTQFPSRMTPLFKDFMKIGLSKAIENVSII